MRCEKCNTELAESANFCLNCGHKLENDKKSYQQIDEVSTEIANNSVSTDVKETKKFIAGVSIFWSSLDLFSKITFISAIIIVIILIISLLSGKTASVIISICQIIGLFLAFAIHRDKVKCSAKWLKYVILALSVIITILNVSSYSWCNEASIESDVTMVSTPYSVEDCIEKNKDAVIGDFLAAGFYSITEEVIEDLEITDTDRLGIVESISVNGVDDFKGDEEFKSSVEIVITYHSYKRLAMPFSSIEAKTMDVVKVLESLEKVGFVKLSTEELYDIDSDTTDAPFENTVSIEGVDSFVKGETFPLDADIKITTHMPCEKYTLKLAIDFIPNLMFSKYDVTMEIDEYEENLSHGVDEEFKYRLKQGEYTLVFKSAETDSVKGTVKVNLNGDTDASYSIYCTSSQINVETLYFENKSAVGENEAMAPYSASDCLFENYSDIEKIFKNAGFTNISTEVLYDIVFGITAEGEIERISINGKTDFIRGDVFSKDSDIVITYHMKEDDDPNRKEITTAKTTELTKYKPVYDSTKNNATVPNNKTEKNSVAATKGIAESVGQKNARKSAESYLRSSSFSRKSLIKQLEYEQYSHEDAVYAVDNCGADWFEQAVKSAESYLDTSAFSKEGLLEQLKYEGFTNDQAVYGVDNCNADWFEQAAKSAASYLKFSSFSREGLINQLEYEGFTKEQAIYGVEQNGY